MESMRAWTCSAGILGPGQVSVRDPQGALVDARVDDPHLGAPERSAPRSALGLARAMVGACQYRSSRTSIGEAHQCRRSPSVCAKHTVLAGLAGKKLLPIH